MFDITSVKNPKVKLAEDLRERRERNKTDLFLIEGYREILRAHEAGRKIDILFYSPPLFLGANEDKLIASLKASRTTVLSCSDAVFKKFSYRDRPDGLLAIARQNHLALNDLSLKENPFYVVAEAIEKPGNLGTILRSSDACGVDGVIIADRCTDIHNPNVVRASVGTLFTLPIVEASGEETLAFLSNHKIQIVATTPSATLEYTEADLTGPIAVVVGTEQLGLSSAWLDSATIRVKIPMLGVADSLNVATATTLVLYEALRQRRSVRR